MIINKVLLYFQVLCDYTKDIIFKDINSWIFVTKTVGKFTFMIFV